MNYNAKSKIDYSGKTSCSTRPALSIYEFFLHKGEEIRIKIVEESCIQIYSTLIDKSF